MNKISFSLSALLLIAMSSTAVGDSLELADGTVLEGDFVGSSNGIIMFNTGDDLEAYPESEVVGIYLSQGVETKEVIASNPAPSAVSAPPGTRIVIRMVDSVDSKKHQAGHKFRGQLEGAIVANGVTVAPRGAIVYGTVVASQQSGRAVGSSGLALEFTDIMVDDQLYPIATTGLSAQTDGEAKRSAGRTARAAAIGGLIDGSSGAKTGAKVGLGASIVTGGESISVPAGTLLETELRTDLTIS